MSSFIYKSFEDDSTLKKYKIEMFIYQHTKQYIIKMKIAYLLISILVIITLILSSCTTTTTGEAKGGIKGKEKTECNDQIDNDKDGYCDFLTKDTRCRDGSIPGDLDCASKEDNKEEVDCMPVPERCDGYDNDCDGQADEDLPIECNSAIYCGTPEWTDTPYCGDDENVHRNWITHQCNFPGTCSSKCSSIIIDKTYEYCTKGCLNGICLPEGNQPFCGDGNCDQDETCQSCPQDCGTCPTPDSCSDTDGGWVIDVKGTISGFSDNQPYSKTDFCLDNTTIIEYDCSGYYSSESIIPCINVSTNYCSNGACV